MPIVSEGVDFVMKKGEEISENQNPKKWGFLSLTGHKQKIELDSDYSSLHTGFEIEFSANESHTHFAKIFNCGEGHNGGVFRKNHIVKVEGKNLSFSEVIDYYAEHQDVIEVYEDGSVSHEIVTRPFSSSERSNLQEIYRVLKDENVDFFVGGNAGTHMTFLTDAHDKNSLFDYYTVRNLTQLMRAFYPSLILLFGRLKGLRLCDVCNPCENCDSFETDSDYNDVCVHSGGNCNREENYSYAIGEIENAYSRKLEYRRLNTRPQAISPYGNAQHYSALSPRLMGSKLIVEHKKIHNWASLTHPFYSDHANRICWALEIRIPDGCDQPKEIWLESQFYKALINFARKVSEFGFLTIDQAYYETVASFESKHISVPLKWEAVAPFITPTRQLLNLLSSELRQFKIKEQIEEKFRALTKGTKKEEPKRNFSAEKTAFAEFLRGEKKRRIKEKLLVKHQVSETQVGEILKKL